MASGRTRFSARRFLLIGILLAGVAGAIHLKLSPGDLVPGKGGMKLAGEFAGGAFRPALSYQAEYVPEGTRPLLWKVLLALWKTIEMAAVAVGISILPGLVFGFLGSTAWWAENPPGSANVIQKCWRRALAPALYTISRLFITFTRSIHELIWATLFLAAIGLSPVVAIIALVIPYSGTLARVFSELIDEVSRDTVKAYQGIGASPAQVYLLGLVPKAFPDLLSYTFYRFECGLRASAVLGFVGIPTVGYYLKLSFENAHYREVWTYLYALLAVIVLFDILSAKLRDRLQTRAF